MAHVLRLGLRPIVDRVDGRLVAIMALRATLGTSAHLLRADPAVRVQPLYDPRAEVSGSARPIIGEWVRPPESIAGAILYLHGGGYALCSPRTHRVITSRLAVDTGLPVLVPRYRLAPKHPFPAAFDDTVDAYRWLLARGVPASRIVVAGDSAGGHLAAALAGEACRSDLPSPAGIVLFSPWVDLTCELSAQGDRERKDPYITPTVAKHFGRLYVGTHDWSDPRLSLLDFADSDLPPFLIQAGGIEMLRVEAERLAQALIDAGASCELQIWPGQMHAFQMFNRVFPEARAAMREAARFVRASIGTGIIEEAA